MLDWLFPLVFCIGLILGQIISWVNLKFHQVKGVIKVDHNKEICQVVLTSDDLINRHIRTVVFEVDHSANLSRGNNMLYNEEQ